MQSNGENNLEAYSLAIAILLILSVVLLSILVPGGPIENRDFNHMKRSVFRSFNIFLVSLGLTTIITTWFALKQDNWAYGLSFVLGLLYLGVYLLDLFAIFPKSPTKMSPKLASIEKINSVVAILLILLSGYVLIAL